MKRLIPLLILLAAGPALATNPTGPANTVLRVPNAGGQAKFGAVDLSQAASTTNQLGPSKGGTGLNTSASTGLPVITAGTWSIRPFSAPTKQSFFTGSGTYTTPASVLWIKIRMCGGGGGGGAGGTGGPTSGSAGAATTFSTLSAAGGGGGGTGSGAVAAGGGTTLTGFSNAMGFTGNAGQVGFTSGGDPAGGGYGGPGPFGGNGGNSASASNTASLYCSGGGGGGKNGGGNTGNGGGAGGYIEAIVPSPAASYAYATGAGGSGGSAVTNGFNGGAGGQGAVIVEEYYQ